MSAHSTAVNAYNVNHGAYDAYRPAYDPKIVDPFLVELGLASENPEGQIVPNLNKLILEVAVGTGKFTRNLIGHGWGHGTLKVMDPSKGMLALCRENFPELGADDILLGDSYHLPVPDNSVDAVIIAQAFHWFADDASLKEIQRVLKPEGKLGCIWNFEYANPLAEVLSTQVRFIDGGAHDFSHVTTTGTTAKQVFASYFEPATWLKRCCEYIYLLEGGVPQYRKGEWRAIFNDNQYFQITPPELFLLGTNVHSDDDVIEYWMTRLFITKLPPDDQEQVRRHLKQILDETTAGLDRSHLVKPVGAHAVVCAQRT